jgi:hypothetical protein
MMLLVTLFGLCAALRFPTRMQVNLDSVDSVYLAENLMKEERSNRNPTNIGPWRTSALCVMLCAQLGLQPCFADSGAPISDVAQSTVDSAYSAAKAVPVPSITKARSDLQPYVDLARGFKLLRYALCRSIDATKADLNFILLCVLAQTFRLQRVSGSGRGLRGQILQHRRR